MLASFDTTVGMLPMMAYGGDADAARDFPEEKMIRKAFQINPPPISGLEMEPFWMGSRFVDEQVEFIPELVTQAVFNVVVVAQNPRDILLNSRVVNPGSFLLQT